MRGACLCAQCQGFVFTLSTPRGQTIAFHKTGNTSRGMKSEKGRDKESFLCDCVCTDVSLNLHLILLLLSIVTARACVCVRVGAHDNSLHRGLLEQTPTHQSQPSRMWSVLPQLAFACSGWQTFSPCCVFLPC